MKFKKITLNNFRQYIGEQSITFSIDIDRNITLLVGDNLAGKTTLIQSIYWCFYGDLDLPNKKDLANRQNVNKLDVGDFINTSVEIEFIHSDIEYTIKRSWKYRKIKESTLEDSGLENTKPIKSFYFTKIINGITIEVDEKELASIFPYDLSRYFLFDGERLKHMLTPGKNTDVSNAVKTILGLDLLEDTIKHLRKVQNTFFQERKKFSESNEDYRIKYTEKERQEKLKQEVERSIESYKSLKTKCENEIFEIDSDLEKLKEIREFQVRKKEIEKEIDGLEKTYTNTKENMLRSVHKNFVGYLISKTIATHADILDLGDGNSTTITGLHGDAIHEIINRNKCICGTEIVKGSKEHQKLLEQLKYQPPASKTVISNSFIEQAKLYEKISDNFSDEFLLKTDSLSDIEDAIEDLKEELKKLRKKVSAFEDGDALQLKRDEYVEQKGKLKDNLKTAFEELESIKDSIDHLNIDLYKLSQSNNQDALLALREDYCIELSKLLTGYLDNEEEKIYNKLSKEVQSIFKRIVGTKHKILINKEDYSYMVSNESGVKGASTGGDIMVAMSFIAGIIKVAKENDDTFLDNESYPLILDAPFSNLDPNRKKNMGIEIPQITEQLVLISFDELKGVLDQRIGSKYKLVYDEVKEYTLIKKVI